MTEALITLLMAMLIGASELLDALKSMAWQIIFQIIGSSSSSGASNGPPAAAFASLAVSPGPRRVTRPSP